MALFTLLAGLCQGAAEIQFDPSASVSFPTLSVPLGVRASGMGDAYNALGDDVYSLNHNPAGLSRLRGYQLGVLHNEWNSSLGVRQDYGSLGVEAGGDSAWALSGNYFALGSLEERDSSGALKGKSAASVFAISLGYARPVFDREKFRAGLALEYGLQSLYGAGQSYFGASLGGLYQVSEDVSAGMSLNHLGVGAGGFSPPGSLGAGLAFHALGRALCVALDGELPFASEASLKGGMEYTFGAAAMRLGWRQPMGGADAATHGGLSAGAGFKAGLFRLDYAYTPYGELSQVHRVQATLELPGDFFAAKAGAAEGTSESARAFYSAAVQLEKDGDTLKALINYQRAVESYPTALKGAPQAFYTDSVKKSDELLKAMNKGGDPGQIRKLTKENMAAANRELKAGHFKDAIAQLMLAKKIDPSNPEIERLMTEAKKGLELKLVGHRDAARFALNEGNIAMAVENYRKVLNIDGADSESLAWLNKNRGKIKGILQAMDRKAIYFYVGGKLEEAVKAWSEGETLDYFGDVDFRRNIDKARKQLELRGAQ